ncbi:MAG: type II toxin-antitoxin system VapC family toxin [Trueperaceae bacterium]
MYFDTSVMLSLYVEDAFTPQALAFYSSQAQAATVSDWVDLEGKSALAVLVRTRRLPLESARLALNSYEADRREARYRSISLTSTDFITARKALPLEGSLRAGDALHLGIVLRSGLPLVTSDKRLHEAAMAADANSTYLPDT